MTAAYPGDPTGLGTMLYPVGFLIIVLGGYQLFTGNTLTPVTLVLTRVVSIPRLLPVLPPSAPPVGCAPGAH